MSSRPAPRVDCASAIGATARHKKSSAKGSEGAPSGTRLPNMVWAGCSAVMAATADVASTDDSELGAAEVFGLSTETARSWDWRLANESGSGVGQGKCPAPEADSRPGETMRDIYRGDRDSKNLRRISPGKALAPSRNKGTAQILGVVEDRSIISFIFI